MPVHPKKRYMMWYLGTWHTPDSLHHNPPTRWPLAAHPLSCAAALSFCPSGPRALTQYLRYGFPPGTSPLRTLSSRPSPAVPSGAGPLSTYLPPLFPLFPFPPSPTNDSLFGPFAISFLSRASFVALVRVFLFCFNRWARLSPIRACACSSFACSSFTRVAPG